MKPVALLLLLAVAGSVMAEPANNFSNIVQNFAHSHGLKYVQTATDTQNGWSYNFYPQGKCTGAACGGLLVNYRYVEQENCVDRTGLFGDLPIIVKGRLALFTMPHVADNSSQLRDYLTVYDKGGCYSISYGTDGNGFEDSFLLAEQLIGDEE